MWDRFLAPAWPDVLPELLHITKNRKILAYNAGYDLRVIRSNCHRYDLDPGPLGDQRNWGCVMSRRSESRNIGSIPGARQALRPRAIHAAAGYGAIPPDLFGPSTELRGVTMTDDAQLTALFQRMCQAWTDGDAQAYGAWAARRMVRLAGTLGLGKRPDALLAP
ncbi:MAG: hypothetical protein ACT4NY_07225 [Pseudonocardiales bacterium]